MGIVGTVLDIVAALALALGGITLMQETYSSLAWRSTAGRILSWTPKLGSDGKIVLGHTARVSFEADGAATEMDCRGTQNDSDVKAHPVGAEVMLRYPPGTGEMPEIKESLGGRFTFPICAMLAGIGLFVVSSFIH